MSTKLTPSRDLILIQLAFSFVRGTVGKSEPKKHKPAAILIQKTKVEIEKDKHASQAKADTNNEGILPSPPYHLQRSIGAHVCVMVNLKFIRDQRRCRPD